MKIPRLPRFRLLPNLPALSTLLTLPTFLTFLLMMNTASATVTEFNIIAVEPFADGATFGNTGSYERVRGTFKGELDPADARNKVIVNLDKAPRNAAGRIEYEADFFMRSEEHTSELQSH